MRFTIVITLIVSFLGVTFVPSFSESVSSESPSTEGVLIFRVKVEDLWMRNKGSYAEGKQPDDTVEIELPGMLFDPPKPIMIVEKKDLDRSTFEGAASSFLSAGKKGDAAWIVDNYVPEEKANISAMISENDMLKFNTEHHAMIKVSHLAGFARHGQYVLLIVRKGFDDGKDSLVPYPVRKTDGEWKMTNALSADPVFDLVFGAVRSGEVVVKK